MHPSTLTGVVRRLQRQGLIIRWADPRERRLAHASAPTLAVGMGAMVAGLDIVRG